jgi:hypothetical protein
MTLRLFIDGQPDKDQTPVHGAAEARGCEVGGFYWTALAPEIVNSRREELGSVSV